MSPLGQGTITNWISMNPAARTRALLTDTSQNFTSLLHARVRLLSGTQVGAVTSLCSLSGPPTAVNVGQFWSAPAASNLFLGTNVEAGVGNAYVVETWATTVKAVSVHTTGNIRCVIKDLDIVAPVDPTFLNLSTSQTVVGDNPGNSVLWGCRLNANSNPVILEGDLSLCACIAVSSNAWQVGMANGDFNEYACCWFTRSDFLSGARVFGRYNVHDGNGSVFVGRVSDGGAMLIDIGPRGFFNNVNDGFWNGHVVLFGMARWHMENGTSVFWSDNATNAVTRAISVPSGSGVLYVTLPTATCNVAGQEVVLSGEAAVGWGALPLKATNGTGFMLVN